MTPEPVAGKPVIRPLRPEDRDAWLAMRAALYGEPAAALADEVDAYLAGSDAADLIEVIVAEAGGTLVGFVELGLRSYAEGCSSSPVPYLEGWWIEPAWRRRGIGRALVAAAEAWARARGHVEIASDARLDNQVSHAAHSALGFVEVERQVCFRKPLGPPTVPKREPHPETSLGATPVERGFRVRALGEIAIRCTDLDAMLGFYGGVLGLPVLRGDHHEDIVFLSLGESYGGHTAVLALFRAASDDARRRVATAPDPSLHHLALVVDAAEQDAAVAWLRANGLPARVETFEWIGWRGVFTTDPEGNTVKLVARATGRSSPPP